MKNTNKINLLLFNQYKIIFCSIIFIFLYFGNTNQLYSQLAVIVNNNNTTTNLSSAEFKSIFLGDKTKFSNGGNILLVVNKEDNSIRTKFTNIMGKSFSEMLNIWLKKSMNDGLKAPSQFTSDNDIINFVSKNNGAIGFVNTASINNTVKLITIDGKKQID